MTQTNSNSSAPGSSTGATAGVEHLASLYKMSTTAGLGSQEYVAVNITAIVSAVFGLGSILALMGDILLVIPIMGVILGIVALRQIYNSSGTQTGRWLAWLGLISSAIFTVYLFGSRAVAAWQNYDDSQRISAVCEKFGQMMKDQKFSDAYDLFDADFKTRVPADTFKGRLWAMQHSSVLPPVESAAWNGHIEFDTKPNGTMFAHAVIMLQFKDSKNEDRYGIYFRKIGPGLWEIDHIPVMFPIKDASSPQ